jgi:hypothetical protein
MSAIEIILTVIASAGGAGVVIAGLAAWLGKVWADRMAQSQKLIGEIDLDLRSRRIDAYAELWQATGLLPAWPQASDVTYADLLRFSHTLRTWYYEKGGIFLSRSTHANAYGPLQGAIAELLRSGKTGVLASADYDAIRILCSTLRTALANDIESRREGPI